jgi:hypothetical protein
LSTSVAIGQAQSISAISNGQQDPALATSAASGPTTIKFEQNNYSPESLSTADIYRKTRNQLAMAKEELAVA